MIHGDIRLHSAEDISVKSMPSLLIRKPINHTNFNIHDSTPMLITNTLGSRSMQCATHGNMQYPVIIFNVMTDIVLATGILPTVWKLNTSRDARIAVILLFAS
jgi:hypothetical protein